MADNRFDRSAGGVFHRSNLGVFGRRSEPVEDPVLGWNFGWPYFRQDGGDSMRLRVYGMTTLGGHPQSVSFLNTRGYITLPRVDNNLFELEVEKSGGDPITYRVTTSEYDSFLHHPITIAERPKITILFPGRHPLFSEVDRPLIQGVFDNDIISGTSAVGRDYRVGPPRHVPPFGPTLLPSGIYPCGNTFTDYITVEELNVTPAPNRLGPEDGTTFKAFGGFWLQDMSFSWGSVDPRLDMYRYSQHRPGFVASPKHLGFSWRRDQIVQGERYSLCRFSNSRNPTAATAVSNQLPPQLQVVEGGGGGTFYAREMQWRLIDNVANPPFSIRDYFGEDVSVTFSFSPVRATNFTTIQMTVAIHWQNGVNAGSTVRVCCDGRSHPINLLFGQTCYITQEYPVSEIIGVQDLTLEFSGASPWLRPPAPTKSNGSTATGDYLISGRVRIQPTHGLTFEPGTVLPGVNDPFSSWATPFTELECT